MGIVGATIWCALVVAGLAANAALLLGGVIASVMIAQLLEFGMLASLHRAKKLQHKSHEELRVAYYRAYWLVALLYLFGSALWVYLTERTGARIAYGVVFFFLWELAQLALAIMLSSWEEVLSRAKSTLRL